MLWLESLSETRHRSLSLLPPQTVLLDLLDLFVHCHC
jgi:hypothetical protein